MSEIHLRDGLDTMTDSLVDKKPKSMYHTDIEFRNELGELLFKRSNVILLGGRRFTLEKLFNITPPDLNSRLTLNEILKGSDIDPSYTEVGPLQEQCVCLFGVGTGGSGETFGSVANPSAKESNLYNIIPIRYVSSSEVQDIEITNRYFMKVEQDGMYAYYLKRFEGTPTIYLKLNGQDFIPSEEVNVPATGDSAASYNITDDVDAYIEITLKLSEEDVREYFLATDQEEATRINELALYFGHHSGDTVWSDYQGVEAFSKVTFNNESLIETSKELNIIYRIYI